MDNVLVDFPGGIARVDPSIVGDYEGHLDEVPGIFVLMDPMSGAIEAFVALAAVYDTHILSTAPFRNPSAWSDTLEWVHLHLGIGPGSPAYKRLILSHHKNLSRGDILPPDAAYVPRGTLRSFDRSQVFDERTVVVLVAPPPFRQPLMCSSFAATVGGHLPRLQHETGATAATVAVHHDVETLGDERLHCRDGIGDDMGKPRVVITLLIDEEDLPAVGMVEETIAGSAKGHDGPIRRHPRRAQQVGSMQAGCHLGGTGALVGRCVGAVLTADQMHGDALQVGRPVVDSPDR